MKAYAKCPKCGKDLETDCKPCIEAGTDTHLCSNDKEADVVENIKWKSIPESEKELNKIEDKEND